jgi:hypothetical protein
MMWSSSLGRSAAKLGTGGVRSWWSAAVVAPPVAQGKEG